MWCVWLIGLVWAGNAALAADGHGIPAEESARHTTFASDSALIPLQKAGNLLLLECTEDGQTGLFILDSGAASLVLNETYFRGLRGNEEVATTGIDDSGSARRVAVREKAPLASRFRGEIPDNPSMLLKYSFVTD